MAYVAANRPALAKPASSDYPSGRELRRLRRAPPWLPIVLAVVDAGLAIGVAAGTWSTVKLRDS